MKTVFCSSFRAKQERQSKPSTQPNVSHEAAGPSQSHDSHMTKSHDTCRVQIRLPDGRVLRESLPPTARLCDVVECVRGAWPHGGAVHLIQVSTWTVSVCVFVQCAQRISLVKALCAHNSG